MAATKRQGEASRPEPAGRRSAAQWTVWDPVYSGVKSLLLPYNAGQVLGLLPVLSDDLPRKRVEKR